VGEWGARPCIFVSIFFIHVVAFFPTGPMLASIACHLLLYLIWAYASLAMGRPHSDGTWHLLGMFTFLHITRPPFAHIRMGACGLARECCPCFNGAPLVVLISAIVALFILGLHESDIAKAPLLVAFSTVVSVRKWQQDKEGLNFSTHLATNSKVTG
jgi:hypothetical protein